MNILDAIRDDKVFGQHFTADTWAAWLAFLSALFALPMTGEQLELYRKHTGRSVPPSSPAIGGVAGLWPAQWQELHARVHRRVVGGVQGLATVLGPGEIGTIMIIAADRKQSRVIMRYCCGLLKSVPMLRQLIDGETQESIQLRNRVCIEVHTASFRSTRGYTIVAGLLDEVSFWPVDKSSSSPDVEVLNAIRPGMSTIPGAMLLCASSPYARRGALWDAHHKHYGKDDDPILVWQSPTRDMNATVPQSIIDAAVEEDPARAAAEWSAQFRVDVESFVSSGGGGPLRRPRRS